MGQSLDLGAVLALVDVAGYVVLPYWSAPEELRDSNTHYGRGADVRQMIVARPVVAVNGASEHAAYVAHDVALRLGGSNAHIVRSYYHSTGRPSYVYTIAFGGDTPKVGPPCWAGAAKEASMPYVRLDGVGNNSLTD